jgi:Ca2+-binding EF-hand superfamily protein
MCLLALLATFQCAALLPAAAQPANSAPLDLAIHLSRLLTPGMALSLYRTQMVAMFRMADANGDGVISLADIELLKTQSEAGLRASTISELLRYDLDGDGVVTREEIVEVETRQGRSARGSVGAGHTTVPHQKSIDEAVTRRMQADINGDGRIEWPEMLAYARQRAATSSNPLEPTLRMILAMDKDGDGKTTPEEFDAATIEVFRRIDTNGDGIISKEELDAYRVRTGQINVVSTNRLVSDEEIRREQQKRAACAMPKASETATIVLLSSHVADALSTTTIGSQDVAVHTGKITVTSGAAPIYLIVVTFRPTVWRLEGEVGRVERLVLAGGVTGAGSTHPDQVPLIGATGISAERVTFLGRPGCIGDFTEIPSIKASAAMGIVRRELGREPAVLAGQYDVSGFTVPEGIIHARRERRSQLIIEKDSGTLRLEGDTSNIIVRKRLADLASELYGFWPGGVVAIDPDKVVASKPAESYKVLPQQAGLLQLVQSGALTQNGSGEFLIQEKIRFPAELTGAHQVKFLLRRGVPPPEGNPGHSCVMSEETGLALHNASLCR